MTGSVITETNVSTDNVSESRINTVVFPAMGAGFGSVPYDEVARQMSAAYYHYLNPPHRFDWDVVLQREKRITG